MLSEKTMNRLRFDRPCSLRLMSDHGIMVVRQLLGQTHYINGGPRILYTGCQLCVFDLAHIVDRVKPSPWKPQSRELLENILNFFEHFQVPLAKPNASA